MRRVLALSLSLLSLQAVAGQFNDGLDMPSLTDPSSHNSPALSLESVAHDGLYVRQKGAQWRLDAVTPWTKAASVGSSFVKVGAPSYMQGIGKLGDNVFVKKCSAFDDLTGTDWTMRIRMGGNTDYFKPVSETTTFCQMVTSNTLFKWSSDLNGTFVKPAPSKPSNANAVQGLGGSSDGWPLKQGDQRVTLPFWGIDAAGRWMDNPKPKDAEAKQNRLLKGGAGCCHSLKGGQDVADWSQLFEMDVFSPYARKEASLQQLTLGPDPEVLSFAPMTNTDKVMRWTDWALSAEYLKEDDAFVKQASFRTKKPTDPDAPVDAVQFESMAMPGSFMSAGKTISKEGAGSYELTLKDSAKTSTFVVAETYFRKATPLYGLCEHNNPCDPNGRCTDGPLTYKCKCNGGYYGSGIRCQACLLQRTSCPGGSVLDLNKCQCAKVIPGLSGTVYGRSTWKKVNAMTTPDPRWKHTMVAHSAGGKPKLLVFGGVYVASSGTTVPRGLSLLEIEMSAQTGITTELRAHLEKRGWFDKVKTFVSNAVTKVKEVAAKAKTFLSPIISRVVAVAKKVVAVGADIGGKIGNGIVNAAGAVAGFAKKVGGMIGIRPIVVVPLNPSLPSPNPDPTPVMVGTPDAPESVSEPSAGSADPPQYLSQAGGSSGGGGGGGRQSVNVVVNTGGGGADKARELHATMVMQAQSRLAESQLGLETTKLQNAHERRMASDRRSHETAAADQDRARVQAEADKAEKKLNAEKQKLSEEGAARKREREQDEARALEVAQKESATALAAAAKTQAEEEAAANKLAAAKRDEALRVAKANAEAARIAAEEALARRQAEIAARKSNKEEADRLQMERESRAYASLPEFENKREASAEPGVAQDAMGALKLAQAAVTAGAAMAHPAPVDAWRLPKGFEIGHAAKDGRPYYIDHNSKSTSWEPPADLLSANNLTANGGDDGAAGDEFHDLDGLAAGAKETGINAMLPKRLKAMQREMDVANIFDDVWEYSLPEPGDDANSAVSGALAGSWRLVDTEGAAVPRYGHCSVVLGDKWHVSFGGRTLRLFQNSKDVVSALDKCKGVECDSLLDTNSELVSAELTVIFDVERYSWTKGLISQSHPDPRDGHSCVMEEKTGDMFLYGGQSGDGKVRDDLWRLAVGTSGLPGDNTPQAVWVPVTAASTFTAPALRDHSAVAFDGKMFVFGGHGEKMDAVYPKELFVFDTMTKQWDGSLRAASGAFPAGLIRSGGCATLSGNRVFTFSGGSSSLSLPKRRWSTLYAKGGEGESLQSKESGVAAAISTRRFQACAASPDGTNVYMFGGTSVKAGASTSSPFSDMYRLELSAARTLMESSTSYNTIMTHQVNPENSDLTALLEPFAPRPGKAASLMDPKMSLGRTQIGLFVDVDQNDMGRLTSLKLFSSAGEGAGGIFLTDRDLQDCIEDEQGWRRGHSHKLVCTVEDRMIHLGDTMEWDKLTNLKFRRSSGGSPLTISKVVIHKTNSFNTLDDVVYPEVVDRLARNQNPGIAGMALRFDGFKNSLPVANGRSMFDSMLGSDAYTVEAWLKPDRMQHTSNDPAHNGGGCVLSKYDANQEGLSRSMGALMIDGLGRVSWTDRMNLHNDEGARGEARIFAPDPLDTQSWTHVAVTFARPGAGDTTVEGAMKMYVNGSVVVESAKPISSVASATPGVRQTQLPLLGACNDNGAVGRLFRGAMDDVRVWGSARSEDQIKLFLEKPLSTEDKIELAVLWDMNHKDANGGAPAELNQGSGKWPEKAPAATGNVVGSFLEANAKLLANPGGDKPWGLDFSGAASTKPKYVKSSVPMNAICLNDCFDRGECGRDLQCECRQGFTGQYCETTGCPKGCSGHGQCAGGNCICSDGYWGVDCAQASCEGNCRGKGSCVYDWPEGFKCQCQPGFRGVNCEEAQCPKDCSGHGGCFQGKCTCDDGYMGEGCESAIQPGCQHDCAGHGDCKKGVCVCEQGWKGASCTTWAGRGFPSGCDADAMSSAFLQVEQSASPCFNITCECNGCCSGHGGCSKGQCNCDPKFFGPSCARSECGNFPGYTGKSTDRCSGRGSCMDGKCMCKAGYKGDECGERTCDASGTNLNSCSDHGGCSDGKCHCFPGYGGDDCSEELSDDGCTKPNADKNQTPGALCAGGCTQECLDHGTCIGGKCICVDGWKGVDCTIPLCINKCSGHGKCTKYGCQCTGGFQGGDCGTDGIMPLDLQVICDSPSLACISFANEAEYKFEREHGLPRPGAGNENFVTLPEGFLLGADKLGPDTSTPPDFADPSSAMPGRR